MGKVMLNLICENCEKEFQRYDKEIEKLKRRKGSAKCVLHFCCRKCSQEYKNKQIERPCGFCGKLVQRSLSQYNKSKSGEIFCSSSCATSSYRTTGIGSYRDKAFEIHGSKCFVCGYDNILILEVHHKDKNRSNNPQDGSNWMVLCPTHHKEIGKGVIDARFLQENQQT